MHKTTNKNQNQTSLATLYTLLSLPLFYSSASTTLLILTALDALLLLAFTIVSVLLGRPISHLNCRAIRSASAASSAESAWAFAMALASGRDGSAVMGLTGWAGSGRAECFQTKAVWGLGVACCVLFATTSVVLPVMWWKGRRGSSVAHSWESWEVGSCGGERVREAELFA